MLVTVLAATPSRKEEHSRGSEEMVLVATPSRKERHKCSVSQQAQRAISNPPPRSRQGNGELGPGKHEVPITVYFYFVLLLPNTHESHEGSLAIWNYPNPTLSHPIPQSKSSTGKVAVTGNRERALGLTALQR